MPLVANTRRARFTISGRDFEPAGREWLMASPQDRKAYWKNLGVFARDAKRRELQKSLNVEGRRMPPRKRPRRDGARGPVLIPHHSESRFIRELRFEATTNGVVLWWTSHWAPAVRGHAERMGGVRNVIGLTEESQDKVREQARQWWAGRVKEGRFGAAAVTRVGLRPTGTDGLTVWYQGAIPSRSRDSIFALPAAVSPVRPLPAGAPASALANRVGEFLDAATRQQVGRADVDIFMGRFGRVPLVRLNEVLARLGVREVAATRDRALDLLRRNLLSRLREPGRSGQTPSPPAPRPRPRPTPRPQPRPEPQVAAAAEPQPSPQRDVPTEDPRLARWRAQVAERLATLPGEIDRLGAEIERLREEEERLKGRWDAASFEAASQARDARRKLVGERAGVEALYRRLLEWEENRKSVPTLVPPGPIRERIAEYTEGDRKIEAILRAAEPIEARRRELETARADLNRQILEAQREDAALVEQARQGRFPVARLVGEQDKIHKRINTLMAQRDRIRDEVRRLDGDLARAGREAIAARDPINFGWTDPDPGAVSLSGLALGPPSERTRVELDEALRWLSRVVERGDGADSWRLKVGEAVGARAQQYGNDPSLRYHIMVAPGVEAPIVIHEFGHALDEGLALGSEPALHRSREYLRARSTSEEATIRLRDRYGGAYEGTEFAYESDFARAFDGPEAARRGDYTAKSYHNATEVLSMGLELLYRDPVGFARRDREYLKFVLGVLDGSLR